MDNNDNNNENNNNESAPSAGGISEEQVIKIVNQAVSNHVGRRTKQFDDKFADFSSKIEQLITAQAAAPAPPADSGAPPTEDENRARAMQAQMDKLSEQLKRSEQMRVEEESKRKESTAKSAVKDALIASGVPGDRVPHAMAYLNQKGVVNYNDVGDLEYTMDRGGFNDYLSVSDGVSAFLDTDEGKFYLPPREVSGSGNTGGTSPSRSPRGRGRSNSIEDMSDEDVLRAVGEAMMNSKPVA